MEIYRGDETNSAALELEKDQKQMVIENERANMTLRSTGREFLRHTHLQRRELERIAQIDYEYNKTKEDEKYDLDRKLAEAMDEVKRKELRDIKLRQLLHRNSPELRQLEQQLRTAYTSKALKLQIAENEALKLEEKVREQQANDAFYNYLRTDNYDYERQLQAADCQRKEDYRNALNEQLQWKERERKIEYRHFLHDKQILDEIAEKLREEERMKKIKKLEKVKKTQKEINEFNLIQEQFRQKEQEQIKAENERLDKILKEVESKQNKAEAEKKAKLEAHEKLVDKMSKALYEKECIASERRNIIEELRYEEANEASEQRKRDDLEKQFRMRLEMSYMLEKQIQEKEDKIKKAIEDDVHYREELKRKIMQEERIEQMTAERKRRAMIEVRKTIEQMMLERQQKHAEEIQNLWRLKELEKEDEKIRLQAIEIERKALLKEHVKNLIGYIPPGVLTEDDFKYLEPDVVAELKGLTINNTKNCFCDGTSQ